MDSNFLNYISKELPDDEIEIWFQINNIIPEKMELFDDFCISLFEKIEDTYLGDSKNSETKITLSDTDNKNHFDWCWKNVIDDFSKENIHFNTEGEHYVFLQNFFEDAYYKQKDERVKKSIKTFMNQLFNMEFQYTKSDLDMLSSVYKSLEKNMLII